LFFSLCLFGRCDDSCEALNERLKTRKIEAGRESVGHLAVKRDAALSGRLLKTKAEAFADAKIGRDDIVGFSWHLILSLVGGEIKKAAPIAVRDHLLSESGSGLSGHAHHVAQPACRHKRRHRFISRGATLIKSRRRRWTCALKSTTWKASRFTRHQLAKPWLTLISDDNFSAVHRTELLQFTLVGP
jgi:hypothetical protein